MLVLAAAIVLGIASAIVLVTHGKDDKISTSRAKSQTAAGSSSTTTSTSTTKPANELAAVSGRVIALDPGHNGGNFTHGSEISRLINIGTQTRACDTSGTATNDGYRESTFNLDVVLRLRQILTDAGATVVLSRTDDNGVGPCIDERAAFANRAHADVAISVHADGGPATGRGFHVIYPPSLPGLTDDIAVNSARLARRSSSRQATCATRRMRLSSRTRRSIRRSRPRSPEGSPGI